MCCSIELVATSKECYWLCMCTQIGVLMQLNSLVASLVVQQSHKVNLGIS